MKKIIDTLTWVGVFLTISSLICTLLTTYHFVYINHFGRYNTFQGCLALTMIMGAISMFDKKQKIQSFLYSIGFGVVAIFTIFFMYHGVF